MAKKKNITIFFPCVGRRVVLLNSFRKSARQLGLTSRIVGADSDQFSPALQCCDRKFVAKRVADPGYARQMLEVMPAAQDTRRVAGSQHACYSCAQPNSAPVTGKSTSVPTR